MKIHEYYGQGVKPGDVGLEIEVEYKDTVPLNVSPGGVWLAKEDNSIGYGLEYITRSPLRVGSTLLPKIQHLTDQFSPATVKVDSTRAGVHVHVNVQELTALQVWTAALAYWLIENVLVLYCGTERMHNHFCLRVNKAEGLLGVCYSDLSTTNARPFNSFRPDVVKYSSLNLATVSSLGTMEVRGMKATIDPVLIAGWAEAMFHLIHVSSRAFSSPEEVFDAFLSSTKDNFLMRILPMQFVSQIRALPNYEGLAKENKKILAPLAYHQSDWKAWHSRVIEAENKRKSERSVSTSGLSNTSAQVASLAGTSLNYVFTENPFEEID